MCVTICGNNFPNTLWRLIGRISEGTVIEVQITTPDGRTFTSNLKVQQEDIEAVKSLQNYQ